ncbi:hypothetical protein GCM10010521_66070 [Streptomyces rameus]|uniref:Uncharacterized protein n=1 Tax=Streptomyces rameus TaxID=68261 RepID=A0ABP6HJR9_9ACTN
MQDGSLGDFSRRQGGIRAPPGVSDERAVRSRIALESRVAVRDEPAPRCLMTQRTYGDVG